MSEQMHYCYSCMTPIGAAESECPHCHAPIPFRATDMKPHDLPLGSRLKERFIIGRVIGRGGFGVLYLAYDEHMRTTRAIKEFFPRNAVRNKETLALEYNHLELQTDMEKSRFLEEARLLTAMQDMHIPNVLRVFDEFEENNTSYILMEYVEGTNLDNYLQDQLKGRMPWQDAVEVMQVLLNAVEQLHKNGIIHRDISLSNVMRRPDGTLCLIDFGSAWQMTSRSDPYTSRKPAYSPKEQWENGPQGVYSDIYALGVCLFKLIVGGLPKDGHGDGLPLLRSQAIPDAIPEWLETAVSTATQVDPKNRYASCAEFLQALHHPAKRKKSKLPLLVCLLLLLAAGAAFAGIRLLTGSAGGIKPVQRALSAMGYLNADKPSGKLDPETLLAMEAFCTDFDIRYTGQLGDEMEQAILNAVAGDGRNLFLADEGTRMTTFHTSATADLSIENNGVSFATLHAINTDEASQPFLRIGNLGIREKGMYTLSADVRALDDTDVALSVCGSEHSETFHITGKNTRISLSVNCTDPGDAALNGYVDFFGAINAQNRLYIYNIKVEKGSKATPWSTAEPATPEVHTIAPSVSVQMTDTPEPSDAPTDAPEAAPVNPNLFGFNKHITLSTPGGGSADMLSSVNGLIFFTDENGADGTLLRIENPGMTEMGFYTFSADVESSCETDISVSLCDMLPARQFHISGVRQRIEVTANCTQYVGDGAYTGFVSISGSFDPNCMLQLSNIKIEKGSTATEWSMAPEDDPNAPSAQAPVSTNPPAPTDAPVQTPTPEPTPSVPGNGVNLFGFDNGVEAFTFANGTVALEQQQNGLSFTGSSNDSATTFLRIGRLNMTEAGYYTFSANVRATQDVTVSFDICDSEMHTYTITPSWQRISFSTYCESYVSSADANGFADVFGLITEGNTITFANVKIENGNVPTPWSAAIVSTPVITPQPTAIPTPEPTPEPTATPIPEIHGDGINLFGFLNGVDTLSFADAVLSDDPAAYGVRLMSNAASETTFLRIANLNMAQEGFYTFSADVYSSHEGAIILDLCDTEGFSVSLRPEWQHVSFSAYCGANSAGFADAYGALLTGQEIIFSNIKIENGSVPTDWSMAPADIPTPTPEPTATPVPEIHGDSINLFGFLNGVDTLSFADAVLSDDPAAYGVRLMSNAASETTFLRIANLNMAQEGYYTFSADVYSSHEGAIILDLCDTEGFSVSLRPEWQHVSFSAYCSANSAGFADAYGALLTGQEIIFSNIKIENGSVPTDWSMAPADIPTPTPEPTATPVPEIHGDGVNLFGFLNGAEALSFADTHIFPLPESYGFELHNPIASETTFLRLRNLNMAQEGFYTFSADVYASHNCTIRADLCDVNDVSFALQPDWQHISFSAYCSAGSGFVDFYGALVEGQYFEFSNIKVENGNVPTPWSMAPSDVPTPTPEPTATPTPEPTPEPTATPVPEIHGDGVNLFGFLNGVDTLSFADAVLSDDPAAYGIRLTSNADSETTFLRIANLNMAQEGFYTFSADVYSSHEGAIILDLCDTEGFSVSLRPEWQHVYFSAYCGANGAGFADAYGALLPGQQVVFSNIKIESGNIPSAFSPAPGDAPGDGVNLFDFHSGMTAISFANMVTNLSPADYGVYTYSSGESETTFLRVTGLKLPEEGYYTFSADVYAAYDCAISMDLCDTAAAAFSLASGQQHITFSTYCGANENGFLDAYGYIQPGQQLTFANIKIEQGNIPSAFSFAPNNVPGDTQNMFGFANGTEFYTFADAAVSADPDAYGIRLTSNADSETTFLRIANLNMAQQGFYSFSADVYSSHEGAIMLDLCDTEGFSVSLRPEWQHVSFSVYCGANSAGFADAYGALLTGQEIIFSNIKIENGNIPSLFSVAY